MFSYYGSKSKIVDLYPPPKFDKIIEPFAGSARYSLKYWQKDVLLVDKYEIIVKVWQWLQKCSKNDIAGLPSVKRGDNVTELNINDEAKWLMGFCINRGSIAPKNIVADFCNWDEDKKRIISYLDKIKHWTIQVGTYDEIPNFPDVTWFIDPPYKNGGEYYKFSSKELDFEHLGKWCMERTGQTIVCENTKADWLPFKPMAKLTGQAQTTTEAIWSNLKTNYDNVQMGLF